MEYGDPSKTDQVFTLLQDHLGGTNQVVNSSGAATQMRYGVWGAARDAIGSLPTSRLYTGQEKSNTGLYYYNARWYDSELSRFVQPDTIIPDQYNPLDLDRFAYTRNNPINFNDPTGHCLVVCTALIGGAIGAVVGAVGYTAYSIGTGSEFNTGYLLMAAGGGAAAGALIGTGVGISAGMSTAAATSAAVTGAGVATTATTAALNATGGDPSDEINAGVQAYGNLSQASSYAIQQANQLKSVISGTGLQAHHLIEQRLAPAIGQTAAQAQKWLSVAVTPAEHQLFTNAWRSAIGYINSGNAIKTTTATLTQIWTAAQQIYADYPALLDGAKKTLGIE